MHCNNKHGGGCAIALGLPKQDGMLPVLNTLVAAFSMLTLATTSQLIDSKWAAAIYRLVSTLLT